MRMFTCAASPQHGVVTFLGASKQFVPSCSKASCTPVKRLFLFRHFLVFLIQCYAKSVNKKSIYYCIWETGGHTGREKKCIWSIESEYPKLEGTHKDPHVQLLALHSTTPNSNPYDESVVILGCLKLHRRVEQENSFPQSALIHSSQFASQPPAINCLQNCW